MRDRVSYPPRRTMRLAVGSAPIPCPAFPRDLTSYLKAIFANPCVPFQQAERYRRPRLIATQDLD